MMFYGRVWIAALRLSKDVYDEKLFLVLQY
jgi:hypothetical protein